MSSARNRGRQRATIIGSIVGFIIILSFVITLIAPDLGRSSNSSDVEPQVFDTPVPTQIVAPTPDPNPQITGAPPVIHQSGVFRVFQPAGRDWEITESGPTATSDIMRTVIRSANRLIVIHNYIQPGVEFESPDSLSEDFLTANHFEAAWGDYDSWVETDRRVTDNAVIVDFNLVAQGIGYLARAIDWDENGWLYATHIVVPSNNPAMLELMQENAVPGFAPLAGAKELPLQWPAFIDQPAGYLLKYPAGWQRVAGDIGRPVTFAAPDNLGDLLIRTWTQTDRQIETEEQAADWLATTEATAVVKSIQPVKQAAASGYAIAYSFTDTAGDPRSGLTLLLNDASGTLFIAELQTELLDTDLLTGEDIPAAVLDARRAAREGFVVLAEDWRTDAAQ